MLKTWYSVHEYHVLLIVEWTDKKDKMDYRMLGRTGWKVSTISLGTWAMGSSWGAVDDRESLATLNRALDLGVNFFDTADVYGSEPLLGQLRRQRSEPFYIATKMGVTLNPDPQAYLSLIHISEPTRLGMISYAVF